MDAASSHTSKAILLQQDEEAGMKMPSMQHYGANSRPVKIVVAALGLIGVCVLLSRPRPAMTSGSTLLAKDAFGDEACSGADPLPGDVNGVPWLRIVGGPPALPRDRDWVARVCTPAYTGPDCSTPTSWVGDITLCIEGRALKAKVHDRGHVSKMFPKHQFLIKFKEPTSLLGMKPAHRWVLGTSWVDTSFQRNPTAFDLYRKLGGWATETKFVNVMLHDSDMGLYYIGEKIERAPGRQFVPHGNKKHPEESGFLLVVDWPKANQTAVISPVTSTAFNVLYPKKKQLSQKEVSFLQDIVDRADRLAAAAAPAGLDVHDPLEDIIDVESFVRYFIVEEIAKDLDGYAFSDYLYVKDGKLFHAAPWDFDLAFGFDCDYAYYTTKEGHVNTWESGWNVDNYRNLTMWIDAQGWPSGSILSYPSSKRQFFTNIWRHPRFVASFAKTWHKAREAGGIFDDSALTKAVDERAKLIAPSAKRDIEIWKNSDRCGFWKCCHPEAKGDFDASTRYLSEYLVRRAKWIDENLGSQLALNL